MPRGGFRQATKHNPGRPKTAKPLRREKVQIRLPRYIKEWLASQSQTEAELIEKALRKTYHLDPPAV